MAEAKGNMTPPQGFHHSGRRIAAEIGIVLAVLVALIFGIRLAADVLTSIIVNKLPSAVDAKLGKIAAESIRAEEKLTQSAPKEQADRVTRIFEELRKNLSKEETRILVAPRITVQKNDTPNAFALPGGEVFVLSGLLDRVQADDDQLMGVLAHEIGHAVHRHGIRSIVRSGIYGLALSFILGDVDSVSGFVLGSASQLDGLHFSRSMESEADAFGVALLKRCNKNPEGLARFLESLESQPIPEWLSTHPDSASRAKEIRKMK